MVNREAVTGHKTEVKENKTPRINWLTKLEFWEEKKKKRREARWRRVFETPTSCRPPERPLTCRGRAFRRYKAQLVIIGDDHSLVGVANTRTRRHLFSEILIFVSKCQVAMKWTVFVVSDKFMEQTIVFHVCAWHRVNFAGNFKFRYKINVWLLSNFIEYPR